MRRPALLLATTALLGCGSSPDRAVAPAATPRHFAPAAQATAAPSARPHRFRHLTAALRRSVSLYSRPGGRILSSVGPHTEFGSQTVFGVLTRRGDWMKVAASQLPNGRRAWIHVRPGELFGTDFDIRVDRSDREAVLRRKGRAVLRFPVAVGRPGNETPLGRYAVTDKLAPTDGTSPYGCCALALTGHQTRLEPGWPGGDRLAIHGTPAAYTIGQAVSLGCMRAPEKALRTLMRKVPLGAPVVVAA